ncbi:hypothetical protein RHGRI_021393 [Rhododendron griersonianum]|nr:hypothetical protein RHGRI_021393 [Rhododendron griersonianum]
MGDCILQGFTFKVNSGTNIKFWSHKWLGEVTLQATFPRLFMLSTQRYWNLLFKRQLRVWEDELYQNLIQILGAVQIQNSDEDCLQWRWSKDLNFSVKSAYSKWEEQSFVEGRELMAVWKNIVPPKVELFVWMAMQNCIASKSSLVRRGILHSNLDLCPLCNASGESPVHLLLHCDVAWNVWSEMISWWHIIWVSPPSRSEGVISMVAKYKV